MQHEQFDTELHQKDSRTKPKTYKSRIGSLTTYVVCSLKLTWISQQFCFWIPSLSFQSLVYILLQDRLHYLLFSPIFPYLSRSLLEIFIYWNWAILRVQTILRVMHFYNFIGTIFFLLRVASFCSVSLQNNKTFCFVEIISVFKLFPTWHFLYDQITSSNSFIWWSYPQRVRIMQ